MNATMSNVKVPLNVGSGDPEMVADASPLSVNNTPDGSDPLVVIEGIGNPVVFIVYEFCRPAKNVVPLNEVIDRGSSTVRVKTWVAAGATVLSAVKVNTNVPDVGCSGVPSSSAVPFRLPFRSKPGFSEIPGGSVPVSVMVAFENPLVEMKNTSNSPPTKVVELAVKTTGASSPSSVNNCVDIPPACPLSAVRTRLYEPPVPTAGVP